jgi:hypothetical protein
MVFVSSYYYEAFEKTCQNRGTVVVVQTVVNFTMPTGYGQEAESRCYAR